MGKKVTFYVLGDSTTSTKQLSVSISKISLSLIFILLIATVTAIGFAGYDYYHLRTKWLNIIVLNSEIANQKAEIKNQNQQIKLFASDINTLKNKIVQLSDFENKIRTIANIKDTSDQSGIFGLGGSTPEDIDATVPLTKKYNSIIREVHEQEIQMEIASEELEKRYKVILESLKNQKIFLASTPAIRPAKGWVTSKFGYRKSPFTGKKSFHSGYDIANKKGTPVFATADGLVVFSKTKGYLGKAVILDHGHGIVTRYGHLSKIIAKKGTLVKRGDLIGLIGSTGRTTGSHVHYEVRLNGVPVNPAKYILN